MYAVALKERGYQVYVRNSIKSRSGAQIITVNNSTKNRNITQVQVSPGGGRHGESPYVKISTNDIGRFKIVDGLEKDYKSDGKENAEIIFRGEE